jgi:hypothetical protein
MPEGKKDYHHPRNWVVQLYKLLAAGRYAVLWLPEFFILYDMIVEEEGEEAAHDWAIRELMLSIKPSVALKVYRILRWAYLAWVTYRKIAHD